MSFADAVRSCLTNYATFSGRARRSEFWWFALFVALVEIVLSVVGAAIGVRPLMFLGYLALIVPYLAAGVRRLHDTGKSGWMILVGIIPIIGPIILLVFFLTDSAAINAYGPSPKALAQA